MKYVVVFALGLMAAACSGGTGASLTLPFGIGTIGASVGGNTQPPVIPLPPPAL